MQGEVTTSTGPRQRTTLAKAQVTVRGTRDPRMTMVVVVAEVVVIMMVTVMMMMIPESASAVTTRICAPRCHGPNHTGCDDMDLARRMTDRPLGCSSAGWCRRAWRACGTTATRTPSKLLLRRVVLEDPPSQIHWQDSDWVRVSMPLVSMPQPTRAVLILKSSA